MTLSKMLSLFLSNTFLEQHLVVFFSIKEKGGLRILRALSGTNVLPYSPFLACRKKVSVP